MRSELVLSPVRPSRATTDSDAWAVVCFCLAGLAMSLYFAASSLASGQLPLLIEQYNLG